LKRIIKKALKIIFKYVFFIGGETRIGIYLLDQIVVNAMTQVSEVQYAGNLLKFSTPNTVSRWRAKSFSTKEPETLDWIDSLPEGSVLWDIGANVGLYSIYAAKKRNCQVLAFEPSVFNLELLARNIHLNELDDQICIVPLPLNDKVGVSQLLMTSTEWGGALSTFGHDYGWDGKKIKPIFMFQTMGITMDAAVELFGVPKPDFIKLDVDGIEHLILRGGMTLLGMVKGVLIEVNDNFHDQADLCLRLLSESGLVLKKKQHSEFFDSPDSFGGGQVWNQIWSRE
jgi:FkbM family methyltransferase